MSDILIRGMEMPPMGRILIVFPSGRVLEVSADETQNIFREAKAISAVDARPIVHGEWHEYDDDYGKICCSVCEEDAPCDYPWNFCPNCGADMRAEEGE